MMNKSIKKWTLRVTKHELFFKCKSFVFPFPSTTWHDTTDCNNVKPYESFHIWSLASRVES